MAVYVKQNGTWLEVDEPYIKRNGDWIQPEEAYIKEDGQWKLIFDQFRFEVVSADRTETQSAQVLTGQLTDFEDFTKANHFRGKLTEPYGGYSVAVSKEEGRIAIGGLDGSVFVYDKTLNLIEELPDPQDHVRGVDISDFTGDIAVASEDGTTYIYDRSFNLTQTLERQGQAFPLDLKFNGPDLAIAGNDNPLATDRQVVVYSRTFNDFDDIYEYQKTAELSYPAEAQKVSWRSSDGYLAVSGGSEDVYVYDVNLSLNSVVNYGNHLGNTKAAFSSSAGNLAVLDENKVHVYTPDLSARTDTLEQGQSGPRGDLAWDGSGRLAHASSDDHIYIYDSQFDFIDVFENGERDYRSLDWDSEQLLVAGTLENFEGRGYVFGTAVSGFFEYGVAGNFTPIRKRYGPLFSENVQYVSEIDGLSSGQSYEWRAGAQAGKGRTQYGEVKSFDAPVLDVSTIDPASNDVYAASARIEGEITQFDRTGQADVSFEFGKQIEEGYPREVDAGSSGVGVFESEFKTLDVGTGYKFRSKAKFGGVTVLGQKQTFTTDNINIGLEALSPSFIADDNAGIRAEVTDITGRDYVGIFFEFREDGEPNFKRFPPLDGDYIRVDNAGTEVVREATTHPDIDSLQLGKTYEYRVKAYDLQAGIGARLPQFDTGFQRFSIIDITSAAWSARGEAFPSGKEITLGDSISVEAELAKTGGNSFDYEIREKVGGTSAGVVAQGTQSSTTINETWQVGDGFGGESGVSGGASVEYELLISTASTATFTSEDSVSRAGIYIKSPKVTFPSSKSINADEGSGITLEIDFTETTGLDDIGVTGAQIVETDSKPSRFSIQSGSVPSTIPAGQSKTITLNYDPPFGSSGEKTARFELSHSNIKGETSPLETSLSGTVNVLTEVEFTQPASSVVTFNDTFVSGTQSDQQTVKIKEGTGSGTFDITDFTISGTDAADFSVSNQSASLNVDQTETSIVLEFEPREKPSGDKFREASFEISHDADLSSSPSVFSLEGQTKGPKISVSNPSPVKAIRGTTNTFSIGVSETTGITGLNLQGATLSGSSTFGNVTGGSQTISAGTSSSIEVDYSPTEAEGTDEATLSISHNGLEAPNPLNVKLIGSRESPPVVVGSDVAISAPVGSSATNTTSVFETGGDYPANVTGVSESSGIFAVTSQPSSIPKDGSELITVEFSPTSEDDNDAETQIEISYNGQGLSSDQTTTLTASGIATGEGELTLANGNGDGTYVFDTYVVGTSNFEAINFTNTGNVPTTLNDITITNDSSGVFQVISNLEGTTFDPGDTFTAANIDFEPDMATTYNADLTVSHSDGSTTVGLEGAAIQQGDISSFSFNNYTFTDANTPDLVSGGDQKSQSSTQSAASLSGESDINITGVSITNSGLVSTSASVAEGGTTQFDPDQTSSVSIQVSATADETNTDSTYTETVEISYDVLDVNGDSITSKTISSDVSISVPAVNGSATDFDFGDVEVNTTSTETNAIELTATNGSYELDGTVALTGTTSDDINDFTLTVPSSGTIVSPNNSVFVDAEYTPDSDSDNDRATYTFGTVTALDDGSPESVVTGNGTTSASLDKAEITNLDSNNTIDSGADVKIDISHTDLDDTSQDSGGLTFDGFSNERSWTPGSSSGTTTVSVRAPTVQQDTNTRIEVTHPDAPSSVKTNFFTITTSR